MTCLSKNATVRCNLRRAQSWRVSILWVGLIVAARGAAQSTTGAGRRRCAQLAWGVIREEGLMTTVHPGHSGPQSSGICEVTQKLLDYRLQCDHTMESIRVGSRTQWKASEYGTWYCIYVCILKKHPREWVTEWVTLWLPWKPLLPRFLLFEMGTLGQKNVRERPSYCKQFGFGRKNFCEILYGGCFTKINTILCMYIYEHLATILAMPVRQTTPFSHWVGLHEVWFTDNMNGLGVEKLMKNWTGEFIFSLW